ncbi:MAG: hypothetical protein ABIP63_03515 [Thermoanaerobaculia bacterium]
MSDVYRKWGRVARWEHGVLVRAAEAGESRETAGEFRVEPMQIRDAPETLPEPDVEAVERAAKKILTAVEQPLAIERLIVTEGVSLHQFGQVQWQERVRRVHLSIARRPFRMLIDAAGFELDGSLLAAFAGMTLEPGRPSTRIILEPRVSAAFLSAGPGQLALEQARGQLDGRGQQILDSPVSSDLPPNWYRPSYRVRPVRSWFNLRAVPHGTIDPSIPRAVALLSFPMEGRIHALCVEEEVASPRWISAGRITAAGPPAEWYPYGAGCWGADMLLESHR